MVARFLLCFCVFVVQPAFGQDAASPAARIKAAQYALGMVRGPQRIDAINTMEYWGTGNLGGGAIVYHASLSYLTPAMRIEITRGNPPQHQFGGTVNGNYAWDESVPGAGFIPGSTATPMPADAKNRLLDLWATPHGSLKAAERAGSNAKVITENGATVITFPMAAPLTGITMKVTLNAKNQPEKVQAGDVEITYSDYKDLGEIKSDVLFPSHMVIKKGRNTLDLAITKVDANNPYVVFPVPPNVEQVQR